MGRLYIYLHEWLIYLPTFYRKKSTIHVGKYTVRPMDPMDDRGCRMVVHQESAPDALLTQKGTELTCFVFFPSDNLPSFYQNHPKNLCDSKTSTNNNMLNNPFALFVLETHLYIAKQRLHYNQNFCFFDSTPFLVVFGHQRYLKKS